MDSMTELYISKFLKKLDRDTRSGKLKWGQWDFREDIFSVYCDELIYTAKLNDTMSVNFFNVHKDGEVEYAPNECLELWLDCKPSYDLVCSKKKNPEFAEALEKLNNTLEGIFGDAKLPDELVAEIDEYFGK